MKRAIIAIRGRVQGVFFRHTARVHAEGLGLAGWIKNKEDGSVAILVEGEEEALEKFLAWCRKGPPLAAVETVAITWNEPTGEFKKFEIL